jgi:peroxiredoxin
VKLPHVLCVVSIWLALSGLAAGATNSGQKLAEGAGKPLLGTRAPRLVLKTIDGETIDLARIYGKQAVYLKFWATWCVPCREQMPHFEHTYESAGPDLAVIAVDVGFNDSIDDVRTYRRRLGITMPIVFDDGQAGAAFHLRVTPQHIVIGRDGRIQYVGHLADARLDAALVAARAAPIGNRDAAGAKAAAESVHYTVGDRLPGQSPLTIDGKRFRFTDSRDRRHTVLVFLSPWCESYLETTRPALSENCRRMRERVNEVAEDRSVRWLGIASGLWATPHDLREYRSKYGVQIPLSLDQSGVLFRAFNVNQVPAALVTDGTGRIVRRIEPRDLETSAALRAAVNAPD